MKSFENINIVSKPTKEKNKNWSEVGELLSQKVDGKVKIINKFWQESKANQSLSLDSFSDRMKFLEKEVLDCFDSDFKNQYEEYLVKENKRKEIETEIKKIEEKYRKKYDDENEYFYALENDQRWNDLFEKAESFFYEKQNLSGMEDVLFVEKIKHFTENIISKKETVLKWEKLYNNDEDAFFESLSAIVEIKDKTKVKVNFSGISMNIIVSAEIMKQLNSHSRGMHFNGTVINVILENSSQKNTIEHEENHNLSESFAGKVVYSKDIMSQIKLAIVFLEKLKSEDGFNFLREECLASLKSKISNYYLKNFSEIIADIDKSSKNSIENYIYQFFKSREELNNFINNLEDKELFIDLSIGLEKLEEKFTMHIKKTADIYFVSENADIKQERKGAMLLFGNDLGKIERYLKDKIGEAKYDVIKSLRYVSDENNAYFSSLSLSTFELNQKEILDVVFEEEKKSGDIIWKLKSAEREFYKIKNLKKLLKNLESLKESSGEAFEKAISLIDKNKIENSIVGRWLSNMDKVEDWIELDKNLKSLAEITGIQEFSDQVEKTLLPEFCFKVNNKDGVNLFNKILESDYFSKDNMEL